MTSWNCMACHGEGLKVQDRVATKMSHPFYTNCTQCHVELSRTDLQASDAISDQHENNLFQGVHRAGPGS
ncbi:MAG TPA: hypothetical protein PKA06_13015, partial [Gemmatales bacterium]|nr:hypothetical protein [Gemmatales bacterium]